MNRSLETQVEKPSALIGVMAPSPPFLTEFRSP